MTIGGINNAKGERRGVERDTDNALAKMVACPRTSVDGQNGAGLVVNFDRRLHCIAGHGEVKGRRQMGVHCRFRVGRVPLCRCEGVGLDQNLFVGLVTTTCLLHPPHDTSGKKTETKTETIQKKKRKNFKKQQQKKKKQQKCSLHVTRGISSKVFSNTSNKTTTGIGLVTARPERGKQKLPFMNKNQKKKKKKKSKKKKVIFVHTEN